MKSIAVFIPVYNGGFYLRETLQSILDQTYQDFNVYLVNDSSTDNSLEIISEFALKDSRIVFYTKENGGGTAKSWNFILPKIKDDFLFYMSQDDILTKDIFDKMIRRQAETNADCILPDMVWFHQDKSDNRKMIGIEGNRSLVLTGIEALKKSLYWEIHGFALRKIELYQNEHFFEDSFDTDEYMTRKFFYKSKKVAFSTGSFFYRQDNPLAITKTFSSKNYYSLLSYLRVYSILLKSHELKSERKKWFNFMVNNYLNSMQNLRQKKGITTSKEETEVKNLLKNIRRKLLYNLIFLGKFWSKAVWTKKLFFISKF